MSIATNSNNLCRRKNKKYRIKIQEARIYVERVCAKVKQLAIRQTSMQPQRQVE